MKKWAMYSVMLLVGLFLKFGYGPGYFTGDNPHLSMNTQNAQVEQSIRVEHDQALEETTQSTFSPELQKQFHLIAAKAGLFRISRTGADFGILGMASDTSKRAQFFRVTRQ